MISHQNYFRNRKQEAEQPQTNTLFQSI